MLVATQVRQRQINVGLGELMVSSDQSVVLSCIGLGSCIALCAFDPVARVGGVAHMLLPSCKNKNDIGGSLSKYIDTGTPLLINRMLKLGAGKENLILKIAGGARMLHIPGADAYHLDIGQKNIAEVKAALARESLPICGSNVGGGFGRTLNFYLDIGRITVKTINGPITEL